MYLKEIYGDDAEEEVIWELAVVEGENRGRLYGFGLKSRTCNANRVRDAVEGEASAPTKSTATSASDAGRKYSKDEVADLVAESTEQLRTNFANEIAAQERRHKAEMDEATKNSAWTKECIARLFATTGTVPPPCNVCVPISLLY